MPQRIFRICPQLYSKGVCTTDGCEYQHDVHFCEMCRVMCPNQKSLASHLNGKRHRARSQATHCSDPSFCTLCKIKLPSPLDYQKHIQARAHVMRMEQKEQKSDPNDDTQSDVSQVPPDYVKCDVCENIFPAATWSRHVTSLNHRKKERYATIQAAFYDADMDKHGITVSHGGDGAADFGIIDNESNRTPPPSTLEVTITLATPGRIDITDIRLSSSMAPRPRKSRFSLTDQTFPTRLWLQKPFVIPITFDPGSLLGRFHDRLEIVFLDTPLQAQFAITRTVQAVVGNKADLDLIKPSAPYQPKNKTWRAPEGEVIPGVKPPALAEIVWTVPLPQAPIPKALDAVLRNRTVKMDVEKLKARLPRVLNSESYRRHFKTLLWAEEATMNIDIQHYDAKNVPLDPLPLGYFRLPVPGLAEKRPSVIVGDRILVQSKGSPPSERWFEGHVHRVRQHDVDLKFHESFSSYKGQKYNIRFKVGRLPLRRMHQALDTAFLTERVLFPREEHVRERWVPTKLQTSSIRTVNKLIQENPPQLLAVTAILHMPPGSVPFVIFGPPGTGKTVTTVEAMRQILLANADARILACAPSNSAADLIAERLIDNLSPSLLFRLNAPSRNKDQLPKVLERFSRSNDGGTFSVPPLKDLMKYRVVVSTCISASVPYGMGMARGHFTYIFIDEAGQASEPESMIPIKTMADNNTNIIISGDPKQLGPIIRSPAARELGLGLSYLDRLMACNVYDPTHGHGISVVKLIKNWRSHPVILKYPNDQFYKGELEPCGDKAVTHSLLRSEVLVRPGFPIVFHGITGKDMREASSPSFFNPNEASLVKKYVEDLYTDRKQQLKDELIGVIAPYHAQVVKIRTLLKKAHPRIKVGSVEEFQGQERRVIIISAVRSSIEFVDVDVKQTLGFVANPRRFNVAVTRAQALLIVIGDPSILSLDPLWRGFMNYIYVGGGWKGKEPDWNPEEPIRAEGGYDIDRRQIASEEMDALIQRTQEVIIESAERLGTADGEEVRADLPWHEAN